MTERDEVMIPVGRQVLRLDDRQEAQVRALLERGMDVELVGSRVWIERRGGGLLLHVSDLQVLPT